MATSSKAAAVEEPHGYEFFGPPGAFAISFGLPILVYVFNFVCNDISGCPAPSLLSPKTLSLDKLKVEVGWPENGFAGLLNWEASAATAGYMLLSMILYRILPAIEVEGTELRNGGKLKYRFNTMYSSTVTLAVLAAGTFAQGAEFPVWTFISDNFIQILTANILFAYGVAHFVYIRSFSVKADNKENRELAAGGHSGNLMYDWFIGRELNPRVTLPLIGEIDLKEFLELRPGMMGWIILNCSWCAQQYRNYGFVTDSAICITAVQALYVVDSWWNEPAILTTIDITNDGFGFMLSFGDIVWLPFVYSLPVRYLSVHPLSLGPLGIAGMLSLIGLGFYIFRSANNEKNRFRTNPDDPRVAHLKYLQTKRGSKLLISGWWGVARHINYFGDWIQSWPYCLPTGIAGYQILSAGTQVEGEVAFVMQDGRQVIQGEARGWGMFITYFYVLYFAILLIHRDSRDDEKCQRKYGEDWEKYKKIVRWRIVPGIY
ncbi:Delta(14)-sterol reductase [Ilyonectria robusta]|uniref:Delta(14)-sterol reductase n=1 Tax=Ilyonectria robusta TaxID=1079257 RepID=UPI001E8D21F9|nr:Delta(14)-sterol reductase [Ilyonectria robusta]KAH6998909.1 Delta(14)-sterol reductase [Ilyonectria sp. MPI-CAGE-AT-0026]KAH8738163.1 Delta(14)-sterol reductase [Ilyonectria robusta]